MANVVDVMKYVKASQAALGQPIWGEVQMQKLVYYVQAWSLAWDGHPMFAERVEAWKMGPVTPAIRFRDDEADISALNAAEAAVVDAVLAHYGRMNGTQLTDLSHSEAPWADTWAARGHDGDRCSDEISRDDMRRFYTEQAMHGRGPKRPLLPADEPADDAEIMAIARANQLRWHSALELLAQ